MNTRRSIHGSMLIHAWPGHWRELLPDGQAIEYELGLGNGKRMAGDALGIGIDGIKDLLYRPQIDKGELMDFYIESSLDNPIRAKSTHS